MRNWRILMRKQLEALIALGYWPEAATHARLYNSVPCWLRK